MKIKSGSVLAGIDIGTNSIRLIDKDKGIVYDEPCAVALDKHGQALAIGSEAMDLKAMSDAELSVVLPFEGKKANLDALDALLEELCMEYKVFRLFQKPTLLVAYPTSFDEDEVAALQEHLLGFGAANVYCEEQIWVAAIGAGLNFNHPIGSVVLNVGHSNADIALFSRGKLVQKMSGACNGKKAGQDIDAWLRQTHQLAVSASAIEQIKRQIGSALPQPDPKAVEITGIDLTSRTPRKIIVDANQIASVMMPFVSDLAVFVHTFLNGLPANFQQDVMARGIVCCGGMMSFDALAPALQSLLGCPFFVADDPAATVANGLKILMNRMESLPL